MDLSKYKKIKLEKAKVVTEKVLERQDSKATFGMRGGVLPLLFVSKLRQKWTRKSSTKSLKPLEIKEIK